MIPTIGVGDGYRVPRVILGAWQQSSGHSARVAGPEEIFSTWDQALARGLDTFDCADIYTGVEALIGDYVRRRRAAGAGIPKVHTKFVPDLAALRTIDRGYVERIVDRSLTRLALDRLDLVQFHWWDYQVPGYLEVMGWLGELARAAKIAHLGLTNFDTARTRELLALGVPIATAQVQYSVLDQRPERGLAAMAAAAGVGLVCYGTVAGGFLSERWLGQPEPAPGIDYNFTAPMAMRLDEAISGVRTELGIKVFGDSLPILQQKAAEIRDIVAKIPGAADVSVDVSAGAMQVELDLHRAALARYGLNVSDVREAVQSGIGGATAIEDVGNRRAGRPRRGSTPSFPIATARSSFARTFPSLSTRPGSGRPTGRPANARPTRRPHPVRARCSMAPKT